MLLVSYIFSFVSNASFGSNFLLAPLIPSLLWCYPNSLCFPSNSFIALLFCQLHFCLCFLVPYPQLRRVSLIQVFIEGKVEEKERKNKKLSGSSFEGGLELFGAEGWVVQGRWQECLV